MSAGVITANIPRKIMVARAPPLSSAMPKPRMNAWSKLPMKSFSKGTWAIENPPRAHTTGTMSRHQKFIMSMLSTFRERSMPP